MSRIKIFTQEGEFEVVGEDENSIQYRKESVYPRSLSKSDKGITWDYIQESVAPWFEPVRTQEEVYEKVEEKVIEDLEELDESEVEIEADDDSPESSALEGIEKLEEQEDEEDRHESD